MLKNSVTYDRVSGYFSSKVLAQASSGFSAFCNTENPRDPLPKMRLIVGARLQAKDEATLLQIHAPELENEICDSVLGAIEEMAELDDYGFEDRICGLAWMIQKKILEIKIGVCYDVNTGRIKSHNEAEFHEKIGIVTDGENSLSFQGSVNETSRGWLENYESIDVYRSWEGEQIRINDHISDFDELWYTNGKNVDLGVAIYSFPEAAKEKLLERFPAASPKEMDEIDWAKKARDHLAKVKLVSKSWKGEKGVVPTNNEKWVHQQNAVEWFLDPDKANGVGIFQMATGSGKTRTAINAAKQAVSKGLVKKTIICVPKTLEEQWAMELAKHYSERKATFWWRSGDDDHLQFFNLNVEGSVMIVSNHYIPKLLEFAYNKPTKVTDTLIIVDEMHHLGETRYKSIGKSEQEEDEEIEPSLEGFVEGMFQPFLLRLGLSATPW